MFCFFSILISEEYKYCFVGKSETDFCSIFTQAGGVDEEKYIAELSWVAQS